MITVHPTFTDIFHTDILVVNLAGVRPVSPLKIGRKLRGEVALAWLFSLGNPPLQQSQSLRILSLISVATVVTRHNRERVSYRQRYPQGPLPSKRDDRDHCLGCHIRRFAEARSVSGKPEVELCGR